MRNRFICWMPLACAVVTAFAGCGGSDHAEVSGKDFAAYLVDNGWPDGKYEDQMQSLNGKNRELFAEYASFSNGEAYRSAPLGEKPERYYFNISKYVSADKAESHTGGTTRRMGGIIDGRFALGPTSRSNDPKQDATTARFLSEWREWVQK